MSAGAENLLRALRSERAGQAYLAAGPADAPLGETIEKGAAALLCEAEPNRRPCGACPSCRMIGAGSHPDLLRLAPEPGKKQISVTAVRQMQGALSEASVRRGRRVVLCEEAHRMTPAAQNALLKTLEEPPEGVTFLLSGTENGLLPTIRSRCMIVRLSGAPKSETEEEAAARRAAEGALEAMFAKKAVDRAALGETRPDMDRALEAMTEYCRDVLACKLGASPLRERTGAAISAGEKQLLTAIDLLTQARKRLLQNAGVALTADWLLARFEREVRNVE